MTNSIDNDHHISKNTKVKYKAQVNISKLPSESMSVESKKLTDFNEELNNADEYLFLLPEISPLLVDDVKSLPQTYIYTAHHDILRDDGYFYANRLRENNVSVTHFDQKDAFHGMLFYYDTLLEGRLCLENILQYIQQNI